MVKSVNSREGTLYLTPAVKTTWEAHVYTEEKWRERYGILCELGLKQGSLELWFRLTV